MAKIEIELSDLKELLNMQRQSCGEHISRNITIYHWSKVVDVNLDKAKDELQEEARNAPYPKDFQILTKYLK